MSSENEDVQHTQHAFLVAWGWFAEHIGLLPLLQATKLHQKKYYHTPQGKVLEFLVAILGGLPHLRDISQAAHPLDKDRAVAEAWGQESWADYSGVSRTLQELTGEEVSQVAPILEQVGQPFLESELELLRQRGQRLRLDGDLTGLPVSNTSRSYPHAAFGHMDDEIRLGYQAAMVSLQSPTYGRLWLSVTHHPGDTVSCTQAEALVQAAEARTGRRPRRRTELLRQRLQAWERQRALTNQRLEVQQQAIQQAQERWREAEQQREQGQEQLVELQQEYQAHDWPERPTSRLAQVRQHLQALEKRCHRRSQAYTQSQSRLAKTVAHREQQQAAFTLLSQRLIRCEQDNASNPEPVEAEFRLDAGFGTYENIALLIEMGYEVYTKPYSHRLVAYLQRQVDEQTPWVKVGANAEMVVWPQRPLQGCPYPLDVALERFYMGNALKHSVLCHFGTDSVTEHAPAWFKEYNGRQTVEAGIKESKQVFYLHHLRVRSEPAIYLQECFVIFAANFVRWASHWLARQNQNVPDALNVRPMGIKQQVQVGAHASAQVIRKTEVRLLRFSEYSALAGSVLRVARNYPPLPPEPCS